MKNWRHLEVMNSANYSGDGSGGEGTIKTNLGANTSNGDTAGIDPTVQLE